MIVNPGDRVILSRSSRDENPTIHTVTKVTKTQITLDTGVRFTHAGREWGRADSLYGARIERYTDEAWAAYETARAEKAAALRVRQMREACATFVMRDLAADEVQTLYDYLRNMGMPEAKK